MKQAPVVEGGNGPIKSMPNSSNGLLILTGWRNWDLVAGLFVENWKVQVGNVM